MAMSEESTKGKILESAERLFAQKGPGNVSLRSIVADARANIASVNYHFGSKDELVREVFRRRIVKLNEERRKLLASLREKHKDSEALPVKELLRAFLLPALNIGQGDSDSGKHFFRLVARAHAEDNPVIEKLMYDELHEIIDVFLEEIGRSLPELGKEELAFRLAMTAGAMIQAALLPLKKSFAEKLLGTAQREALLEQLIQFCTGGFEAAPVFAEDQK